MAATAQARRGATAPRRDEDYERYEAQPVQRRAPRSRRRAVQRARFTRAFVLFVCCLTVLAVGRVALSFAVVQKTIETDAIAREQRAVTAENAQLAGGPRPARLHGPHPPASPRTQLGLVDADHVQYLRVQVPDGKAAARP